MPESSQDMLVYFTGATFALAVLFLLLAFRWFRRSRRDVFWRQRRQAGQRGLRAMLLGFALLVFSGFGCAAGLMTAWIADDGDGDSPVTSVAIENGLDQTPLGVTAMPTTPPELLAASETLAPDDLNTGPTDTPPPTMEPLVADSAPNGEENPAETENAPPDQLPNTGLADRTLVTIPASATPATTTTPPSTRTPVATNTPARTPTSTRTPTPPPTVVVIITATPQANPSQTVYYTYTPNSTRAPIFPSETPLPNAWIAITALDDQLSDAYTPIDPGTEFDSGTTRIYMFVKFRGLSQGVSWKRQLYFGGEPVDEGIEELWMRDAEGEAFFFFGDSDGFAPGLYEIRVYLGDREDPINRAEFTVLPAP